MGKRDFIFPPDMPEEMRRQYEQAADKVEMEQQEWAHSLSGFFDSLNLEQVVTLRKMMHGIVATTKYSDIPSFWEGTLTGIMHFKFGVCLGCGENHDEVLKIVSEQEDADKSGVGHEPDGTGMSDADYKDMMTLYGLEITDSGALACKNCGVHSASLKDRMLREPGKEGCPGCVQKEKWG